MNRTRAGAFSALVVLSLLLAGCSASAAPTTEPAAAAAPAPTASTEAPLTAPQSALGLTCDELFGAAELQPLLITPVQVRRDESSAPLGVRGAAFDQAGASLCVYGGENRTDSSYDQGLSLQVVPNAASQFDAYLASATFYSGGRMNTIGDRSALFCEGSETFSDATYICSADFVVGGYWVSARLSDLADLDAEAASDLATGVLSTVATRIAETGTERPLWTPPAGADPAQLCTDPASAAALLGESADSLTVIDASYGEQGVTTFGCRWTSPTGAEVGLSALASGGWALDEVAASPGKVFDSWLAESTAFDVAGTEGALVTCLTQCSALVKWRGTLVQVGFDELSYDPAIAAQRLQAWGTALPQS